MMTYYTLANIGYWCSYEACCETTAQDDGTILHKVTFVMLNQFGNRLQMGFNIFSQFQPDEPGVMDENGEDFPTLEAAIRHYADEDLRITRLPGRPMSKPMRHETWQGGEATSFNYLARA